jgi:hypothetical protein
MSILLFDINVIIKYLYVLLCVFREKEQTEIMF